MCHFFWGGEQARKAENEVRWQAPTGCAWVIAAERQYPGPTFLVFLVLWQKRTCCQGYYTTSSTSLKHLHGMLAGHTNIFKNMHVDITLKSWLPIAIWPQYCQILFHASLITLPISKETISHLIHSPQASCLTPYQSLSVDDLPSHSPTRTEDIRNFLTFLSLHPQTYLNLSLSQGQESSISILQVQVFQPGVKSVMYF